MYLSLIIGRIHSINNKTMDLLTIYILLIVIFIHWIADFILQSDWQAKNKSTNNMALTSHVLNYTLVWVFALILYIIYYGFEIQFSYWLLLFPVITFVCHWIQDYITSRINTRLYKANKIHEFFVCIGFDQFLHYIQLFLTLYFLL